MEDDGKMMLKDRANWIVSFFIGALLALAFLSPVTAFSVIDQAACREIDLDTFTCKQRTSEFLATDEWAYVWKKIHQ